MMAHLTNMCGILWVQSKRDRDAVKPLLKRYRVQDGRGTDGFGFMTVSPDGKASEVFRATQEKDLLRGIKDSRATSFLLHHRFPTSLPNYEGATHPLVVKNEAFKYDYYIVHNGVISNYKTLFEEYRKRHKFLTEMEEVKIHRFVNSDEYYEFDPTTSVNDSEIFAFDLAEYIEGKSNIIRSSGTIAFIGLQCEKDGTVVNLIYGHNTGNPLIMEDDKVMFALKSEGHGVEVPENKIFFRNLNTGKTLERKASGMRYFGYNYNSSSKKSTKYKSWSAAGKGVDDHIKENSRDIENIFGCREDEDALDGVLRKMLPVGSSHTVTHNDPNFGKYVVPLMDTSNIDLSYIDEITLEDLGLSERVIDEQIELADASQTPDDAGIMRQLRDDLKADIEHENDAAAELNAARDLYKDARGKYLGKRSNLEAFETAQSMLEVSETLYTNAHRDRLATSAELSAYMGFSSPKDE